MSSMFDTKVMAAVAAGAARRCGVKVTCSGRSAYTSSTQRVNAAGKEVRELAINIPATVLESKEDAAALLRGYLDHEAAHVRWTDWSVLDDRGVQSSELLKTMLNIVEDVRIEKRMSSAFAGAKENLARIAEILFGGSAWRSHAKAALGPQPVSLAVSWLLFHLRSKAQPMLEPGAKALGALLDVSLPGLKDSLESVLDHTPEPDSTRDALDLSVKLHCAVNSCMSSSTGAEEAGTQGAEERRQKAMDAMKKAGMRANAAKRLADGAERNEHHAYAAASRFDKDGVPEGAGSMADAVNSKLDEASGGKQEARRSVPPEDMRSAFISREYAMCQTSPGERSRMPRLRPRTPDEAAASKAVCAGLGQRLRSLLQTQSSVRRGVRASGTRLDGRSLWRAGASDGRIFEGRSQARTHDTEVLLLIDASGSMGRDSGDFERIRMANAAMAGVLAALEPVRGVYAGAVSFSRYQHIEHVVVKWPREKLPAARLPWVTEYGGTDIPESMTACAGVFTPETPRKIMIIVSDGEDFPDAVREAEDRLDSMGVEVAGVSIRQDALKQGLRRCTHAAEPEDIPSAVFGAVQSLLVQGSR